jgi:uncharacterized protein YndB with AHSA1/START domain
MSTDIATVQRVVDASPQEVWSVLADGWTYASWVVGTSRVRAVDPSWPQTGSNLHHSFGLWPLLINDRTDVLECVPEKELLLKARGWPTGEATVRITITPQAGGQSVVSIREDATSGPAVLIPKAVRQAITVPRNREALRRLGMLAVGRRR